MTKSIYQLVTLLVFVTFSNYALANDTITNCNSVDLSNKPPFNTTPYIQNGTGWCASYTAADMISYHENIRLNTNIAASPTAVAFEAWYRYRDRSNQNALREEGSREETTEVSNIGPVQIEEALETVIHYGICSQNKIPVRFSTQSGEFLRTKSALDQLYRYYTLQSNNDDENHCASLDEQVQVNGIFNQIRDIANHTSISASEFYYQTINSICNEREEELPWEIKVVSSKPKTEVSILETIASTLGQSKPVGINYQKTVYETDGKDGLHASIIVGQKVHNNKCVFIVRNTYGHCNCNDTSNNEQVTRNCTEMPRKYNKNISCDSASGHMLIPRDELLDDLNSITYLEEKSD